MFCVTQTDVLKTSQCRQVSVRSTGGHGVSSTAASAAASAAIRKLSAERTAHEPAANDPTEGVQETTHGRTSATAASIATAAAAA